MASISTKVTFEDISREAYASSLKVMGGFHPNLEDQAPENCLTLLLLGPDEPTFWYEFEKCPEMQDGQKNPMDRWSERVINKLANRLNADPVFPFSGPPFAPFFQWALRSGKAHVSPIKLLVHNEVGLFVSFRAALSFKYKITVPEPLPSPCLSCSAPCKSACPVSAFDGNSYNVNSCRSHISTTDQKRCLENGCAARRICPLSKIELRAPNQSAFHMRAFLSATQT